jgi:uroporphyrin-III C-methyltransferase
MVSTSYIIKGGVTLVGFGPGNPDLLTVAAVKALSAADVIYYDDLIGKDYLDGLSARKVYVGKRCGAHHAEQNQINWLLLQSALAGQAVVRLKGGDPMVLAHAGEEIAFLEEHGVLVHVIPGITTASALAASAKVSLTYRHLASSVALLNGHSIRPLTPSADTLVYYMGASRLTDIAKALIAEGRPADTPVLLAHNVSLPDERIMESSLAQLVSEGRVFPTPLIVMIGKVAGLRHHKASDLLAG